MLIDTYGATMALGHFKPT